MSFKSFAREEEYITALDITHAGGDEVCKMTEASLTPSGVVGFEEADEDNGFDEDWLEATTSMLLGAM